MLVCPVCPVCPVTDSRGCTPASHLATAGGDSYIIT